MWTVATRALRFTHLSIAQGGPLILTQEPVGKPAPCYSAPTPPLLTVSSRPSELTRYLGEHLVFSTTGVQSPRQLGPCQIHPRTPRKCG